MTRSYFTCVVLFLALIVLFTSTNAFQWDLERRCFTPPEITTLKETCMEFHLDTCEGLALEMIVTYDGVALIDQEVEDLTEEEVCQDIDAAVGYNGCKTCISFKQGQDFVLKPNFVRLCPIITTKCSLPFLNGDIPINVQELDCFELGSRCDELVDCAQCASSYGCGWCSGVNACMAVAMTAGFDAQGEEIQKETDEAYCSEMCSNDNNYLSEQAEFWVSDASCPGYVPTGEATGGDPQSSASESNINDNDGNDDGNQDGLDGNDDNDDDGAGVNMSRLEKTAVYVVPVLLVFFGVAYWFFDYRKRKQAAAADAKLEVELGQYGTDANNSFDSTEHAAVSSYTDSLQSPGLSLHDVPLNVGVLSSDHPLQSLHARNQQ